MTPLTTPSPCAHVWVPFQAGRTRLLLCQHCLVPHCDHANAYESSRGTRYAWMTCDDCSHVFRRAVEGEASSSV